MCTRFALMSLTETDRKFAATGPGPSHAGPTVSRTPLGGGSVGSSVLRHPNISTERPRNAPDSLTDQAWTAFPADQCSAILVCERSADVVSLFNKDAPAVFPARAKFLDARTEPLHARTASGV